MQKFVRKLLRAGTHSYTVTIPKGIIKKYGWRERQKLVVTDLGRGKLEVRDWRRR